MKPWQQQQMTHAGPIQSERPLSLPDWLASIQQRMAMLGQEFAPAAIKQSLTQWPDPYQTKWNGGQNMDPMQVAMDWGMNPIGLLGRIVHHGTPHQWAPEPGFPAGRPRLDKIGTGEGAQAYGYGNYFADSPMVAKSYAEAGGRAPRLSLDGKEIPFPSWDAGMGPRESAMRAAADIVPVQGVDTKAAMKILRSRLGEKRQVLEGERLQELYDAVDYLEKNKFDVMPSGTVNTLDLPDERIPGLLDWDKPLSEQPEAVRKALAKIGIKPTDPDLLAEANRQMMDAWNAYQEARKKFGWKDTRTGDAEWAWQQARKDLATLQRYNDPIGQRVYQDYPMAQSGISEVLREAGISGLRYLDAGSRGGSGGTSNYVIWDQALLDEMGRRMARMKGLLE